MARKWGLRIAWAVKIVLVLSLAGCGAWGDTPTPTAMPALPQQQLRLFLLRTYDMEDASSTEIRIALLETLARSQYDTINNTLIYTEYALDVRSHDSPAALEAAVQDAIAAIRSFAPHIVVTMHDAAARYVIPEYPDPALSFVFCALAGDVAAYGLNLPQVTGVLERPNALETLRLAKQFVPRSRFFFVLGDETPLSLATATLVAQDLARDDALTLQMEAYAISDWAAWQQFVLEESRRAGFILLLKHAEVYDAAGNLIPAEDVLAWTLLNSAAPVFTLWRDIVARGAVGGLTVTAKDQGVAVGKIILQLQAGKRPLDLPLQTPERNELAINLAAAEHWGLRIPVPFLLAADVGRGFPEP